MFRKVLLVLFLIFFSSAIMFAGGSSEKTSLSGNYAFGGSTTVDPIITAAIEEWRTDYSSIHISYEGVGSSNGVKGVLSGQYSLGAASREPKEKEKEMGVVGVHIALDAIAPIVNSSTVTISNLTIEQLAKIYAGEIINWQEVGGPNKPIVIFNRDEASGTYETFEKKVLGDFDFIKTAGVVTSNGDMTAKVGSTPYSIGYVGLGFIDLAGIKPVNVNGIEPKIENIYNKSYSIWRYLNIVFAKEYGLGEVEQKFVSYLLGEEGQAIVEEEGFISLPDDILQQSKDLIQ